MKKSLAVIALAGSIAFAGAVPAMAAVPEKPKCPPNCEYVAPPSSGTVSDGTVAPGQTFTFSGTGFLAGEPIAITVTLTSAPQAIGGGSGFSGGGVGMAAPVQLNLPMAPQAFSTTADANGNFAFPMSISDAGTYALAATGQTSGHTVTASVTVAGAAVGTGTALANTGRHNALANTGADSSLALWSLVGAGALAAGVTSVVVVRRRAKAEASA